MKNFIAIFVVLLAITSCAAYKCSSGFEAATRPWTPEEMASAIPLDMEIDPPVNYTKPGAPMACGTPTCTVQRTTSFYTSYPGNSVVKIFFMFGSSRYVCSGSVGGDNLIWTAGHCVYQISGTTKEWAKQLVVHPGYYNGNSPYQQFTATRLCTSDQFEANAWTNAGIPYDYALAIFSGKPFANLQQFPLLVDRTTTSTYYNSYGYGAASPYDGYWDVFCPSYGCDRATGLTPQPVGIASTNTGGSSGGPWIVSITGSAYGIAGINSFKYTNNNNAMYSSYLNGATQSFFTDVSRIAAVYAKENSTLSVN